MTMGLSLLLYNSYCKNCSKIHFSKTLRWLCCVNSKGLSQWALVKIWINIKTNNYSLAQKFLQQARDETQENCKWLPQWDFVTLGQTIIYTTEKSIKNWQRNLDCSSFKKLSRTKKQFKGLNQWAFVPLCLTIIYTTEEILQILTTKPWWMFLNKCKFQTITMKPLLKWTVPNSFYESIYGEYPYSFTEKTNESNKQ